MNLHNYNALLGDAKYSESDALVCFGGTSNTMNLNSYNALGGTPNTVTLNNYNALGKTSDKVNLNNYNVLGGVGGGGWGGHKIL